MNRKNTPKLRFKEFEKADPWEQRKLGELCERVTRKNITGESDLPLTIASQYGLIDQRDFFNKVVAAKDMSNYYLLKKGEFAYNKSYSNGYDFGSIKRLNAYEQGCLSTLYICFGITSDDIESDYLECFFDTLKWYSDITMICAEGARNHGLLNVDTKAFFDEVTIEMPSSKEEQRKISSYLNNLDNLITLHQCKHNYTPIAFALQKTNNSTPSWEQRKLGDLINETRDKTTVEDEDTLLSCAIDGMFLNSELFSHFRGSSNIGYLKVKKNDLILSAQNLHLVNCNVNLRFEHGIISPAYKDYELIECDPLFIQAWVKQDKTKDFFLKASTEGASVCRKNIVWEELYKQELPVPKIDEQIKIGAFFENIDNLITLHQR